MELQGYGKTLDCIENTGINETSLALKWQVIE